MSFVIATSEFFKVTVIYEKFTKTFFALFCFFFFFFIDPWPHCEGAGLRWEWGFGGFS